MIKNLIKTRKKQRAYNIYFYVNICSEINVLRLRIFIFLLRYPIAVKIESNWQRSIVIKIILKLMESIKYITLNKFKETTSSCYKIKGF